MSNGSGATAKSEYRRTVSLGALSLANGASQRRGALSGYRRYSLIADLVEDQSGGPFDAGNLKTGSAEFTVRYIYVPAMIIRNFFHNVQSVASSILTRCIA